MSDMTMLQKLNSIDVSALINDQKKAGRSGLAQETIDRWKTVHEFAQHVLGANRHGEVVLASAHFLALVTESIAKQAEAPMPRYQTYSEVKLLDWFIGEERGHYEYYKRSALTGIYYLLADLQQFESASLAGQEVFFQKEKQHIDLTKRVNLISNLLELVRSAYKQLFGAALPPPRPFNKLLTVQAYALEESRLYGLLHFTCFPRTQFHDEYLFVRSIHVSEFCFLGIQHLLKEAMDHLEYHSFHGAHLYLGQAVLFADILHGMFKVMRTMPSKPQNNFALFREATGNASAVQSKNYQELDIILRGVDPKKLQVFRENTHLGYLEKYAHPKFTYNLRATLKSLDEGQHKALFEVARQLDKKLKTWRGLHLGFAKAYLPKQAVGTGATEGEAYLQRLFESSSLFANTEIDTALFADQFSKEEFFALNELIVRVNSKITISANE